MLMIFVTTVLTSTASAFGLAEKGQMLTTSAPESVGVEAVVTGNSGSINSTNGSISGTLSASFNIQTNDPDGYDFIMYSIIQTTSGEASAFDNDGNILFGNTDVGHVPTLAAINSAKAGNGSNPDVIGYKFLISEGADTSVVFDNVVPYGECYKINLTNSVTESSVTQSISGSPKAGTYSNSEDTSGTYQTTVYVTAVSK